MKKSEKVTPAKVFNMIKAETEKMLPPNKRWTRAGKEKFPFVRLTEMGITNYTRLKAEYSLVKSRKSGRSRMERIAIENAYKQIQKYLGK